MSVDDDIINQVVAEQMLKSQKWKVVKATDGIQALKYIEKTEVGTAQDHVNTVLH